MYFDPVYHCCINVLHVSSCLQGICLFWLHTEKLLWDILIGMCISANMDPLKNEMGHLKRLSMK